MRKVLAFLFTFVLSVAVVTEVRTERKQQCFGCTNMKCVIRLLDEDPKLLVTHPLEVGRALLTAPDWWD